jgi:hypothetical protein
MYLPNLLLVLNDGDDGGSGSDLQQAADVYNPVKQQNPLKMLRKALPLQTFPNMRYSLAYVNHWRAIRERQQQRT